MEEKRQDERKEASRHKLRQIKKSKKEEEKRAKNKKNDKRERNNVQKIKGNTKGEKIEG